ncbi:Fanconi anemia group G protein [Pelodytes ibericus]
MAAAGVPTWPPRVYQHGRLRDFRQLEKNVRTPGCLPPIAESIPLELTVLYNVLIMKISLTKGGTGNSHSVIEKALIRALEANQLESSNCSIVGLWKKVLAAPCLVPFHTIVRSLAFLHTVIWLSEKKNKEIMEMYKEFSTGPLVDVYDAVPIMNMISACDVLPGYEMLLPFREVKDVTLASFSLQQGLCGIEKYDFTSAFQHLKESVKGSFDTLLKARVMCCQAFCLMRTGKRQAAMQFLRQALVMDYRCRSALFFSSLLYREMGREDLEIEVLCLLHKTLCSFTPEPKPSQFIHLISPLYFVDVESCSFSMRLPCSTEVAYLIALRCLQTKKLSEACISYMEVVQTLAEELYDPPSLPSPISLPPQVDILLEAIATLLLDGELDDALGLAEEVIDKSSEMIPSSMVLDEDGPQSRDNVTTEQLNCIMWSATSLLFQGKILDLQKKHTEAVTMFSRCLEMLFMVQFENGGELFWNQSPSAQPENLIETDLIIAKGAGNGFIFSGSPFLASEGQGAVASQGGVAGQAAVVSYGGVASPSLLALQARENVVFETLKLCAFMWRSEAFTALWMLNEALMSANQALHYYPACPESTTSYLCALWRLERKQEAAYQWKVFQSNKSNIEQHWKSLQGSLPPYILELIKHKFVINTTMMREIQMYATSNPPQDPS